jgi:SH3 domain protein
VSAPPNPAGLGQRYVKDFIIIPLRSADSAGSKIVHPGLKSGTAVKLLQVNNTTKYSLVKTAEGVEGWIGNQFLMAETPATVKLAEAEATIKRLIDHASPDAQNSMSFEAKYQELLNKVKNLEDTNNTLSRELEHVKSLSGTEVKLSEDNKKLVVEADAAKRVNDTLMTENQSLKDQLTRNTFINGAIAVILGILATLIIQHFARSKKRYSDWA